jgi:hypothetical protein
MRAIVRDPFARTTLVRDTIQPLAGNQSCDFCGGVVISRRCRSPFLYRFGTEPDAIHPRVTWHRGAFCSRSCHDAYHA